MQLLKWFKALLPDDIKALLKDVLDHNSFKSYSQFGEDAYLNSYFRGKTWQKGKRMFLPRHGQYVDIGAYSPTECSNTHAFYKQGWNGINIDATPGVMDSFKLVRKRDINLNLAVGNTSENLLFFCWGSPSVYNTADPTLAREREESLSKKATEVRVKCMPLEYILDEHLAPNSKIDFMSIDVEGLDLEVLQSNNWNKYRPELIVTEIYSNTLEELLAADIVEYLREQGYVAIAWLMPSVIFRDCYHQA